MKFKASILTCFLVAIYAAPLVFGVVHVPGSGRKPLALLPLNEAAYVGSTVVLRCEASNLPPDSRILWWEFTGGNAQLISDNYGISMGHPNAARYRIISNSPQEFYLEIRDIVLSDGGTYQCIDQQAFEPDVFYGLAELIVIESTMNCTTLVHENGIVMDGQNYSNACDVRYRGGFAPHLTWSGPEPYRGPIEITTDTDVFSGIGYTVLRSFDQTTYSVDLAFDSLENVPAYVASNAPNLTEHFEFNELYVYWGPTNLSHTPAQQSYLLGDVITCDADAFPPAFYRWQNMVSLEIIYSQLFTVTEDMVGATTLIRCEARNLVQGLLYSQNLFIDIYVPAPTTIPTVPTTTTQPLDAPCNDLSGWWQSYSPYAELNLIVSNDGYGRVTGGLRNYTDQYTVEVAGRTRVSDYAYLGLSLIYPSNKGIVGLTGECHRCSGKEVLIVESIWRSITDSIGCGDGGTPGPSTSYEFFRYDGGLSPGSLSESASLKRR